MSNTLEITIGQVKANIDLTIDTIDQHITHSVECVDANVEQHVDNVVLYTQERAYVTVSPDDNNRLESRTSGLYVSNNLIPDPLAYYILAKS